MLHNQIADLLLGGALSSTRLYFHKQPLDIGKLVYSVIIDGVPGSHKLAAIIPVAKSKRSDSKYK